MKQHEVSHEITEFIYNIYSSHLLMGTISLLVFQSHRFFLSDKFKYSVVKNITFLFKAFLGLLFKLL